MKYQRICLIVMAILPVMLFSLVILSYYHYRIPTPKPEPLVEPELYVRLGSGKLVKYSDLQPGYLSEVPKALPAKESVPVVKEKPHHHNKATVKTAVARHSQPKKVKATTVLARQTHPKKQVKAKNRRIKDREDTSSVTVVASQVQPKEIQAETALADCAHPKRNMGRAVNPRHFHTKAQDTTKIFLTDYQRSQVIEQISQIEPELAEVLIPLARCESGLNPFAIGDYGNSFGPYQIFLDFHPDVSLEEAQNVDFATRWTARKIRQGEGHLWTCWWKIWKIKDVRAKIKELGVQSHRHKHHHHRSLHRHNKARR